MNKNIVKNNINYYLFYSMQKVCKTSFKENCNFVPKDTWPNALVEVIQKRLDLKGREFNTRPQQRCTKAWRVELLKEVTKENTKEYSWTK